jgi:hypothetical protein
VISIEGLVDGEGNLGAIVQASRSLSGSCARSSDISVNRPIASKADGARRKPNNRNPP